MKEVWLTMKVDGRITMRAMLPDDYTKEDLEIAAMEKFMEADLGNIECVESEFIIAEDDAGNYVYEK